MTFEPVPTGEQLRAPNADGAPRGSAANPFAPMTVRGALDLHGTARPIRLAALKLLRARTACLKGTFCCGGAWLDGGLLTRAVLGYVQQPNPVVP